IVSIFAHEMSIAVRDINCGAMPVAIEGGVDDNPERMPKVFRVDHLLSLVLYGNRFRIDRREYTRVYHTEDHDLCLRVSRVAITMSHPGPVGPTLRLGKESFKLYSGRTARLRERNPAMAGASGRVSVEEFAITLPEHVRAYSKYHPRFTRITALPPGKQLLI